MSLLWSQQLEQKKTQLLHEFTIQPVKNMNFSPAHLSGQRQQHCIHEHLKSNMFSVCLSIHLRRQKINGRNKCTYNLDFTRMVDNF